MQKVLIWIVYWTLIIQVCKKGKMIAIAFPIIGLSPVLNLISAFCPSAKNGFRLCFISKGVATYSYHTELTHMCYSKPYCGAYLLSVDGDL